MSLDIAIWRTERPIGDAAAGKLYARLVEGDLSGLTPHPSIDAFYEELVARHPEIDDVPLDNIDDATFSPWSCRIDRSPCHLVLACVFSAGEMVGDLVGELQRKHGVTAYVPGDGTEYHPHDE
jgi:hypothetical protein